MLIPKEVSEPVLQIKQHFKEQRTAIPQFARTVGRLEKDIEDAASDLRTIRKLAHQGAAQMANVRCQVSPGLARFFGAVLILGADSHARLQHLPEALRERIVRECAATLQVHGVESRAALTEGDIPLPEEYGKELHQLVESHGLARKFGRVISINGNTKLPRLKTSPAFGFIDRSAAIGEKKPALEFVEFPPEKAGGIIRIPGEIDEDSIVDLGLWLVNYCAREMAKWEDTVLFTADGSATYKGFKGICKTAIDLGKKVLLGPTKTAPSDIRLENLRALRGKVSSAALFNSAYYMHPTFETLLVQFNNTENVATLPKSTGRSMRFADPVYVGRGESGGPELDGFPIRWVPVMPAYTEQATPGASPVAFGDLDFEYLAERGAFTLQTSRDVFFTTDELALRALERFAVGLMADDAIAALQLGS